MDIKSFGCSFIYGSELPDNGKGARYTWGSRFAWPACLARHGGHGYRCHARPGAGNLQIMEQVLNQTVDSEVTFFIINWTWIDRFDYISDANKSTWYGSDNAWLTLLPADESKLSQTYYRELHSEYRDKLTNLLYIKTAIDTLTFKNIPFIMTYMDRLLFDTTYHTNATIQELQQYVLPYMTDFNGMTFLDWSKQHNYPIGAAGHPLEEAHTAASDYMIKVFDKKNTVDR
jgi:hypothetical protein